MLRSSRGYMSTKLPDPSVPCTQRTFDSAKKREQISRVLEIRHFQDSFNLLVYGYSLMLVLAVLLSISNKGEDWPMILGAALFAGPSIGVRFWLRRAPDQHRARAIFSYVFSCLGGVLLDGPLFLTRLIEAPTLPAANMYCIGVVMAIWAFFTVSIGIAFVPRMIERSCMLLGVASTQSSWSELGQPQQTVVTGAALLAGEIMGFVMNQRVWTQAFAQELAHADQVSDIERKTFRVINHTSKRVMSNAALSCELIKQRLQPHHRALGADAQPILAMLDELRTQAINGFNMCKSRLLQTAIQRGEYAPNLTEFELRSLWEELGVAASSRVTCSEWCEGAAVRADKQVLLCILSNAVHNALAHGQTDGPVVVRADVESKRLRVRVSNKAGGNHRTLLALCGDGGDLLCAADAGATLSSAGCGQASSTFLGLGEMRLFSAALGPSAQARLRVSAASVRFELSLPVDVVKRPQPKQVVRPQQVLSQQVLPQQVVRPQQVRPQQVLPADLALVCCDDDLIPRYLYRVLLKTAKASPAESAIVGESYAQVAGLADTVLEKARRLGPERVVCLFDENLDGYEEGSFKGSEIIAELRARDFTGLAIIRSANDEPNAVRDYIAAGADGFIGKAVKGGHKAAVATISRLWHSKHADLAKAK